MYVLTSKYNHSLSASLSQSGLFTLDVLNILSPENYKKPSQVRERASFLSYVNQRARFGKYEWCKLHVVNIRDNTIAATIDIEVAEDSSI